MAKEVPQNQKITKDSLLRLIELWGGLGEVGQAGDPVAARDQLAALLPLRERLSGPEHPNTLVVRNNLAEWTRHAKHCHER